MRFGKIEHPSQNKNAYTSLTHRADARAGSISENGKGLNRSAAGSICLGISCFSLPISRQSILKPLAGNREALNICPRHAGTRPLLVAGHVHGIERAQFMQVSPTEIPIAIRVLHLPGLQTPIGKRRKSRCRGSEFSIIQSYGYAAHNRPLSHGSKIDADNVADNVAECLAQIGLFKI
jgi:hypothetical protein